MDHPFIQTLNHTNYLDKHTFSELVQMQLPAFAQDIQLLTNDVSNTSNKQNASVSNNRAINQTILQNQLSNSVNKINISHEEAMNIAKQHLQAKNIADEAQDLFKK